MRLRFSLRMFLICFTTVAVAFGAGANLVYQVKDQVRRQKASVATLEGMGVRVDLSNDLFFKLGLGSALPDTPWIKFCKAYLDRDAYSPVSLIDLYQVTEVEPAIRCTNDIYGVQEIWMSADTITSEMIDLLSRQRELRRLTISWSEIEPSALPHFRRIDSLEAIFIKTPVNDATVSALTTLPRLENLHVDLSELTPLGDQGLGRFKQLKAITIHGDFRKESLGELLRCRSLCSLWVDVSDATEPALEMLTDAHSVTDLTLIYKGRKPPTKLFEIAARCPNLKKLFQGGEYGGEFHAPVAAIANHTTLKLISLRDMVLENGDLAALKRLKDLECIWFTGELSDSEIFDFLTHAPKCEVKMEAPYKAKEGGGRRFTLVDGKLQCERYNNAGWCGT